jgi:hypothetical protein
LYRLSSIAPVYSVGHCHLLAKLPQAMLIGCCSDIATTTSLMHAVPILSQLYK